MNGTLAVAARELKEKWTVLVAALVAGLVALAVPVLSSLGRHDAREARELAALVFATAFSCAVALVTGGGMITRELVERRHSFLFSRPLSASAIWAGKVLAAWLLAVGSGLAALLPAAVVSRGLRLLGAVSPWGDEAATLAVVAAALLALVVFSHAVALMVRSRVSWLLALDVVVAVAVSGVVAWAARDLHMARAGSALARGAVAFAALAVAGALAAGLAQVSRGRTDPARGHKVLSSVLWGTIACGALLFAGYARWVLAAGPRDLVKVGFVAAAPRGGWVGLLGSRAAGRGDYYPQFLLDTASGRSVRLALGDRWGNGVVFSDDGRVAAWLAPVDAGPAPALQVLTLDLAAPGAEPLATTIVLDAAAGRDLALSDDGRLLALSGRALVEVHELPSGRLAASARLPAGASTRAYFPAGGRSLRLESRALAPEGGVEAWKAPSEVTIRELDLRTRALSETGRIASVTPLSFWVMQHDLVRDRTVVTAGEGSARVTTLRVARTGAVLTTLCAASAGEPRALFLGDGGVAVAHDTPEGAELRVFTREGIAARAVALGSWRRVWLGGEAAPGRVVVHVSRSQDAPDRDAAVLLVDTGTGAAVRLASGVRPIPSIILGRGGFAAGSAATRLFTTADGGLELLDPDSGAFSTLLPGRGGSE